MTIHGSISAVRHLPRYREVVNVFIKNGFGYFFERFSLPKWLGGRRTPMDQSAYQIGHAQRLRRVFEELGPTYIKLGQLLSTRADIMGPEYIRELEKLQDNVPAFDYQEVLSICREEGIDLERDFSYFSPEPIAAASIGQVHEGILKTGERVVVKVKRPGIDKIVKTDVEILFELARLVEKRSEFMRNYRLSEIVAEISEALLNELNFEKEARNVDIFSHNFNDVPRVIIPTVFWQYSSRKVMTMEYVEGIKISDFAALRQAGYRPQRIAENLVEALYLMVIEHGVFHADPHPGNIAITTGEKIVFYDFGQVGTIDEYDRDRFITLIIAMMRYDVSVVARTLLEIAPNSSHVNVEELKREVSGLARKYYGLPLSKINIGEALEELIDLSIRFKIRLPAELALLGKMLVTVERTVSQLDPNISLTDIAEPYGKKALKKRFSRERITRELTELLYDYGQVARNLPADVSQSFKKLNEGLLTVRLEHQRIEQLSGRMDVMSNRLSLAIILAGIIVGTSLVVDQTGSSILARIPIVEIGFMLAIGLGLFLAYSILRSGRY